MADDLARPDGTGSHASHGAGQAVSALPGFDPSRWVRQLPRAFLAFKSVLADSPFLNLPAHQRELAACELDDTTLVKWVRWALVMSARFYESDARKRGREVSEVVTQHGAVALALLILRSNAEKATFIVEGVTHRGEEKGDWRVTIERVAQP